MTDQNSSSNFEDLFKNSFKKYKSIKNNEKDDILDVFDSDNISTFLKNNSDFKFHKININSEDVKATAKSEEPCQCFTGETLLINPILWDIYQFDYPKGLYFIKNPFTKIGQKYWITRCLDDYIQSPNITNIDNLARLKNENSKSSKEKDDELKQDKNKFYKSLRWVTFGFHHNWDTKIYSEEYKSKFPEDLAKLCKFLSIILGFKNFNAEAAIANYYHLDSTLSGHVDYSENNLEAPLFSISYGQTAIFLIGGKNKNDSVLPILLKSGDIVIMSGESRLSYHGVPKILKEKEEPWNNLVEKELSMIESEKDDDGEKSSPKRQKLDVNENKHNLDSDSPTNKSQCPNCQNLLSKTIDNWSDFHHKYITKSRINLNVRQVLCYGQTKLKKKN